VLEGAEGVREPLGPVVVEPAVSVIVLGFVNVAVALVLVVDEFAVAVERSLQLDTVNMAYSTWHPIPEHPWSQPCETKTVGITLGQLQDRVRGISCAHMGLAQVWHRSLVSVTVGQPSCDDELCDVVVDDVCGLAGTSEVVRGARTSAAA